MSPPLSTTPALRVLVVDSTPDTLRDTTAALQRAGVVTATAANGAEALQAAASFRPDLVLAARDLPDLEGTKLCQRIKRDPALAVIFVVLISGKFTPSDEQSAPSESGADGCIARPIGECELVARVAAFGRMQRLSRTLREREQQFLALTTAALDAIVMLDQQGLVTFWNAAAERMFGYTSAEMLGRNLSATITPAHVLAADRTAFPAALPSGASAVAGQTIELAAVRKDGTVFPIELSLSASDTGGRRLAVGILRDITERRRAEQSAREREARLSVLFEEAPIGYHELDADGRVVRVNHTELQMLGYTEADMLGRLVWEFSLDPVASAAAVRAKLAGESPPGSAFERQVHRKDGSSLDVILHDKLIRDAAGRITGIRSSIQDNTAAKRAGEQVRKMSAALEQCPVSVIITDLAGNIEYANPAFSAATGYSFEEARGKNPRILKSGEMAPATYENLWRTIVAGGTWRGEFHNRKKNGELYWEEATISPIHDAAGRTTHYLAVKQDITARRAAEQELRTAKLAAEGAARAKSDFLANMSHEIRTPMNGVIGMTGLLLDTKLDAQQRQFAESVRNSADNLMVVINDILDFSKIEAGKLTFEMLDFSLVETIEGTLDMLAERAQGKGVELLDGIAPDVPTRLRGDPGRLRQVLTNLIGNALKFTEHGEVVVRVTLERETPTHATIRFNVVDTGIGIAPEVQGRLFQSFNQADNSTTRKYGGTGLGLAISKQLVGMMHGQIGVQSEPGRGSTFWFTVELEKQSGDPKPIKKIRGDLFNLRVLVVDDNATNRQILRHQIFAWKMQKGSAAGGHEALKILREAAAAGAPYDLALLDMQMPEMDGMTLARAIKADPAIAATRLVMLTSLGHWFATEELKASGLDAYLVKPVKQSRLFDCLIEVMGRDRSEGTFSESPPAAVASAPDALPFTRVRILVAEDNQVNQKIACAQLAKLGCSVDVVGNGLEAIEALARASYDLVFMDCQMPEMDGYEATQSIRKREADRAHPCRWKAPMRVVAMTANAMQGDREKCLAAGMDDYVSKPMRLAELRAAIERGRPAVPAVTTAT